MVNSEFKLRSGLSAFFHLSSLFPGGKCLHQEPLSLSGWLAVLRSGLVVLICSSSFWTGLTVDGHTSPWPPVTEPSYCASSWLWCQAFLGGPTGSQPLLSSSLGATGNSVMVSCASQGTSHTMSFPQVHKLPPLPQSLMSFHAGPNIRIHLLAFSKITNVVRSQKKKTHQISITFISTQKKLYFRGIQAPLCVMQHYLQESSYGSNLNVHW